MIIPHIEKNSCLLKCDKGWEDMKSDLYKKEETYVKLQEIRADGGRIPDDEGQVK